MNQEAPVQTLLACSQCGQPHAQSDLVQLAGNWVCADCKPAFLSRVMASGAAATSPFAFRYGGFWIRFGARIIDWMVLGVPLGILFLFLLFPTLMPVKGRAPIAPNQMFAMTGVLTFLVVSFVAGGCYEVLMLKYRSATVGKIACGLKVIRPGGTGLSWGVCFGRFFMWNVVTSSIPYLNSILMLVSSIMLGVDNEKRALHDRVCDTRVIHK